MTFILGVDLDGVVAKYTQGLARFVEQETGCYTLPEPTTWNFDNWGFKSGDFMKYHSAFVKDHGLHRLEPMEEASYFLNKLSDLEVWIRIVTHRLVVPQAHGIAAGDTIEWLENNNIPYRDICFMESKPDVNCDLYIDDGPHNIKALQEAGKETIVFDQPYNQNCPGGRVYSWQDVYNYVKESL